MRTLWISTCVVSFASNGMAADPHVLLERARELEERYQAFHNPNGLMHEVTLSGDTVVALHGTSDCAIWTGIYIGAAAARFALYRDDASRAAVRRAIEGVHRLHTVTGRSGLFARCAWKTTDPVAYDPNHPEIHTTAEWLWRGDVSQDQIAGIVFGYGLAFDIIDVPDLRLLIANDISALAHHLMQNDLRIVDVDNQVTEHGDLDPTGFELFGLSMDGFAAAMGLSIFAVAAHVTGDPEIESYYRDTLLGERGFDVMVRDHLHVEIPDALALVYADAECDTNYNNFNMMFLSMFNLVRLEVDPALRTLYETALTERLWADPGAPPVVGGIQLPGQPNHREVRDQGNSFWTYLYYGLVGSPDPGVLAQAEQSLVEYWPPPVAGPIVTDNSATHPEQCRNRFDDPMHKDGVVPVAGRAPDNFLWKRNPYQVRFEAGPKIFAGVDYQVAYWLGRTFGFLEFPDTDQDGLADDREAAHGTDPAVPDTDGDGISDGDEVDLYGTDPLVDPTDGADGEADRDGGTGDGGDPTPLAGDPTPLVGDSALVGDPPTVSNEAGCDCAAGVGPWPALAALLRRRRPSQYR